ncbi:hypothetical protein CHUAL_011763 [Chamberlinius hualienensis]
MEDDNLELTRLQREKKKLTAKNNYLELSRVCNSCGEILFRQGKFREALVEHRAELDACSKTKDILGVANAHRRIGECYEELGDYNTAIDHEKEHLKLATKANSLVEQQRAWVTLGRTYLHQAEVLNSGNNLTEFEKETFLATLNDAENAFNKCFQLCSKLSLADVTHFELEQMKGRYHLNFGLVKDVRNDIVGCISSIEKSIEIHKSACQWDDLFRSHNSLSLICLKHGEYSTGLHHAEEALQVAKRIKDTELEFEVLANKGRIELHQEHYRDGKATLKKCYKLAHTSGQDVVPIRRLLKYASNLNEEKKRLDATDSNNLKERKTVYERLGDLSSSAELYKSAIEYYHLALICSRKLKSEDKDLAPLYVSLALTYSDILKFEEAAHYYDLELKCWKNNPEEKCKSLMNLANCKSRLNGSYEEIVGDYTRALKNASIAKNRLLEKQCLESLAEFQKSRGKRDDEKATKTRLENFQDIVSEEENSASDCSEESLYMSDSCDDDSDETPKKSRKYTCRRVTRLRKNEKGETQLHRACISGKLELVKRLIEDGHPVNIRDNSGWLPIHEAANHGFDEICKLLLDKGATINDRGGDHCNGFTPLHDAAANGQLNVINVLIARGASCIAKDNEGMTPLDRLKEFRQSPENNLSANEISKYKQVEAVLKDKMKTFSSKSDQGVSQLKSELSEVRTRNWSDDESDTPALVGADEILPDCDNWIIDDIGANRTENQRKRRKCDSSLIGRLTAKCGNTSKRSFDLRTPKTPEKMPDRKRKRSADSIFSPSTSPEKFESSSESVNQANSISNVNTSKNIEIGVRVNVKVMEATFLISVPTGETVNWLANEASQRYFAFSGQKPILALSVGNGTFLSLNDQAYSTLKNGDEVVAHFQSWEILPVKERYLEACKHLNTIADDRITCALVKAESYSVAIFAKFKMEFTKCSLVLRAMYNLSGIRELNLSGNYFELEQLQLIALVLTSLPQLQSLDISNCDLTGSSLLTIVENLGHKSFLKMDQLKIGYNPLLIDGGEHLLSFLKCFPNLSSISIPSIGNNLSSLNHFNGKQLAESLRILHKLQKLDLSFTQYPPDTLRELIASLSKVPLTELDLSSTVSKLDSVTLCNLLNELMKQSTNAIKTLCLSMCFLNDECIRSLMMGLQMRNVSMLDVSGNGDITTASVDLLLSALTKDKLNLTSCAKLTSTSNIVSALEDEFDNFDEDIDMSESPVF